MSVHNIRITSGNSDELEAICDALEVMSEANGEIQLKNVTPSTSQGLGDASYVVDVVLSLTGSIAAGIVSNYIYDYLLRKLNRADVSNAHLKISIGGKEIPLDDPEAAKRDLEQLLGANQ
jgi:hypothetical protein